MINSGYNGSTKSFDVVCEENVEVEVDTVCGYTASCKPSCMQKCANPKVYLLIITLFGIFQGFSVNGINNVNITSYERRYLLSSTESSLVAIFYDVSAAIVVLFVGYYGLTVHQPRLLGSALVAMGLGTFTMSIAHFSAPPYQPDGGITLSCVSSANSTCVADESEKYLKNYIFLLLIGQLLNGYGGTCLFSVGVTYLDQSVSTKVAPLYIGAMNGGTVLGPALGLIIGGVLLNFYVDFPYPPPTDLTPSDPAWVGAWWLGFVVIALFLFILAFFMFLFPRELPGTAAIRAAKISQAHDNGTESLVNTPGFGVKLRDLPKAIWYLLKNSIFMFITIGDSIELLLISASGTFLPKIIANQFAQTASWAAVLTGLMAVPASALGQIIGGYICKKFDLKVVGMLKLALFSSVMSLILVPVYLARCPDTQLAGVLAAYPGASRDTTSVADLNSPCNNGCGCTTALYDPVCADGIQYFSPCYAGCPSKPVANDNGLPILYHNCSCPVGVAMGEIATNSTEVVSGICTLDCNLLYTVFVPIGFIQFFFTFLSTTPLTVATLRVVPESQRSLAIALHWWFIRILGTIPGPIIFGALIDSGCKLWENVCGVKGSCWVYDNAGLSFVLIGLVVGFKLLSITMNILAIKFYKGPTENTSIEGSVDKLDVEKEKPDNK